MHALYWDCVHFHVHTFNNLNHERLRVHGPLEGSGLRIPGVEDCDSCIRIKTVSLATLCEVKEANCCATNRCVRPVIFIAPKQVQLPGFLSVERACRIMWQCKNVKQLSACGAQANILRVSNGLPLRQNITTNLSTRLRRVLNSGKYTRIFSMPSIRFSALSIRYPWSVV
jgi:hypothetical protein